MGAMKRRTLKAYRDLYHDPTILFPSDPHGNGQGQPTGEIETILFPNGAREIWLRDDKGRGFRITASNGPAGFGVTVAVLGYATMPVMRGYDREYQTVSPVPSAEAREVNLTFYNNDPRSQAFKRWYDEVETEEDITLLGDEYRRVK